MWWFLLHQWRVRVEVVMSPSPHLTQISWGGTNLRAIRKIALKFQQVFICNLLSKKANTFLPSHAYQCTILYTSRHFFINAVVYSIGGKPSSVFFSLPVTRCVLVALSTCLGWIDQHNYQQSLSWSQSQCKKKVFSKIVLRQCNKWKSKAYVKNRN